MKNNNNQSWRGLGLNELLAHRNKKLNQVARMKADLGQRKMNMSNLMIMNNDLQKVKDKFFKQTPLFEINNMLYPFQYQTKSGLEVLPNNSRISKISVTAEAAFIITEIQTVVFDSTDGGNPPVYMNPEDFTAAGEIKNLKVDITDLSSERTMMEDPISINNLGNYHNPVMLDDPFYLDPNQSLEVRFSNQSAVKKYFATVLFKGYRLRVQDAQNYIQKVTL